MKASQTKRAAAGVVVALSMHACGGAGAPPQIAPTPATRSGEDLAELEALYRARADSALTRFTEADVHFMTGMIGHHAQALVMSRMAPTHDASPSIQTLAARTINAQQDEIATMRGWLADRGQPMHDMGVMPGMLTPEQMRELDAARGLEFDRLFLTYMIQHHSGAVTMVHELFATDGAALGDTVFKVASDIQVDQASEIDRMERMLEALPREDRRQ
ncbi:MAG: DUF305 domain-containing protein [Gemmatimonadota bacterium]|nr:DUF305 domain-containing protein [Gemmatimonadota bacterium]MDH3423879.1 DUF305 domain-containing protein [Gemmatimonadota bacterium]